MQTLKTLRINTNEQLKKLLEETEEEISKINLRNNHKSEKALEREAVRFITGYAITHILNKKINCKNCLLTLIKKISDPESTTYDILNEKEKSNSELLIKCKTHFSSKNIQYCNPSDEFFKIILFNIHIYNCCKDKILHIRNVHQVILDFCIKYSNKRFNNYFDIQSHECNDHKVQILSYIIRILLRRNCSWAKYAIKKDSTKKYIHIKKYLN